MVMTTSTTNSQFAATNTAGTDKVATQAPTSANKDMFTKLLVAQIQNQDPLAPQDPTQYVNQLSQLSQTEALQSLSQMTTASASVLQSLQTLAMGGQVGSEVTVATEHRRLDGDKVNGSIS
jgi:flagellar basal-body rod modification protein FlgD